MLYKCSTCGEEMDNYDAMHRHEIRHELVLLRQDELQSLIRPEHQSCGCTGQYVEDKQHLNVFSRLYVCDKCGHWLIVPRERKVG